ncbi:MAG TPA: hypothetical protein VFS43_05695 [Polyangiaceae bacterium]|nr:hypothetical protein [Polyangiaceae bacterium]
MSAPDTRELEQVLVNTVRQLGEVAAGALQAKLPKPFQRPTHELLEALGRLADRGEIFRHPAAKTKFLAFDARAEVRTLLVGSLGPKALTEAELKKQIAKKGAALGLGRAGGPLVAQALRALVREGIAFVHRRPPPPGAPTRPPPKTLRYASEPQGPLDLRPYVRPAARELRALAKRLASFGATPDAALRALAAEMGVALPPAPTPTVAKAVRLDADVQPVVVVRPVAQPNGHGTNGGGNGVGSNGDGVQKGGDRPVEAPQGDRDTRLLRALDEVAAREPVGSLLLVERVRARAGLDKEEFDRAALDLAKAERVVLHYHDYPTSLPPEELAQLVDDGAGTYYIGIARRRGA